MRRISAQIEALGSASFVLLIGLVAGTIQGIPGLFLGGSKTAPLQLFPFLVIGITAVLWWTAAFLLWWVAVRRRQSSPWMIAAQVTVGLLVADVLNSALSMVATSFETSGDFRAMALRHPLTLITSDLGLSLIFRSPMWFVGSLIAIAMGRELDDGEHARPASNALPTPPEPVA
jgi:hypothetical protein